MKNSPARPRQASAKLTICWETVEAPFGPVRVAATERGICRASLRTAGDRFAEELETSGLRIRRGGAIIRPAVERLERYFAGERVELDLPVDLLEGTPFQRRVWNALRRIAYGRTQRYAWLARAVGNPHAARAVGQANGRNPVALFCPCHRVVAADGSLGGFSAGLDIKRFLLQHEGAQGDFGISSA